MKNNIKSTEAFCDLLKQYKNKLKNRKVFIWGAWGRGVEIQKALKQLRVEIDGYIDSDESKKKFGEPEKCVTTPEILKREKLFVIVTLVQHKSVFDYLDACFYEEYEDYIYPGKCFEVVGVVHGYRDLFGNIIEGNVGKSTILLSGNSKVIIGNCETNI